MPVYSVREGDCIASIALATGFFPETIWNHPKNAELKALRQNPQVLMPGDEVFVPELRLTTARKAVDQRHRFRRKGVPQLFRLQLLADGKPRANLAYRLVMEDRVRTGTTNSEGWLEQWIPPGVEGGKLVLSESESYELEFGCLDPVTEESGVRVRLFNLGYLTSADGDADALKDAIQRFQEDQGLPTNGVMDAATHAKLVAVHTA